MPYTPRRRAYMGSGSLFSKPSRSTMGIVSGGIALVAVAGFAAVSVSSGGASQDDYAGSDYVLVDDTAVSRSQDRSAVTLSPEEEISLAKAAAVEKQQAAAEATKRAEEQAAAAKKVPAPVAAAAPSGAPCASGSAVEAGLVPNTIAVHRAACANFSGIRSYGGRGGGDHATGHALDIMISGEAGWEVANYMRTHASQLGISYVIYSQKIWSAERGSEGWRSMSNRGSATANHYDHVHVSVF